MHTFVHVYNVHLDEKHLTLTIRNYTKFQLWYIKVKSGTNDRSTVEQKKNDNYNNTQVRMYKKRD